MKIIKSPGREFKTLQIVGHRHFGEFPDAFLGSRRVERIGGMSENRTDSVRRGVFVERRDVGLVDGLGRTAARIARKELKNVCAYRNGRLAHGHITAARGKMTSYLHNKILYHNLLK